MIYPKASAKLKIKPWVQQNINQLVYFAREGPLVFYSTLLAAAVIVPTFIYMAKTIKEEPKGTAHQKMYYSVIRPDDYPKELHKYCR